MIVLEALYAVDNGLVLQTLNITDFGTKTSQELLLDNGLITPTPEADPHLQITGQPGHPDPEIKGGGTRSQKKKLFPPFWPHSGKKVGGTAPPGPSPGSPLVQIPVFGGSTPSDNGVARSSRP